MGALRNAAVPTALRPRTGVETPTAVRPKRHLHAAIVTQDVRVHKFLRNKCFLMGPSDLDVDLTVHLFHQDPAHEAVQLDGFVRWSLVENGLVLPADVGLILPASVEIGMEEQP